MLARELGLEDRADRPRVDGVVRVPAGLAIDRADVDARRAADAAKRRPALRIGQRTRPARVDQHEVKRRRAVARRDTPVQSDVYGFIRSPVAERGRSCISTPRSRHSSTTFSMPITVTSVSGSVVHIRPLPSDSTTATVPVSATAKLAPEIATRARRNAARRCCRAAASSDVGVVGEAGLVERLAQDLAISDRPRCSDGTSRCDGRSPGELDDPLGQVGLDRVDPGADERVVQADLVRRQRLDLHDLARPDAARRARRRSRSPRRRRGPSARRRPPP